MKILMVVPNLRVANGVASYAMNYFRLLNNEDCRIDFVLYKDVPTPYYDEIERSGSRCFVLPSLRNMIAHIKACAKILDHNEYDIIHDNTLLISTPLMYVAKLKSVPVRILHSHSSRLGETRRNEFRNKLFLPLLKMAITDNAACSEMAAKSMFKDQEYFFIPNIVPVDRLMFSSQKRETLRRKYGVDGKCIIGTVGRVSPPKNPLFALDVIREVVNINPEVEYWWIGSGSLDEEFQKKIVELKIEDNVKFFGSRDDATVLYNAMDLFFMPSSFEGLGIAALEAQTSGLLCVVSDMVPKEVAFTDLVRFVSLDKSTLEWAEIIIDQIGSDNKRYSRIDELTKSPFSEKSAARELMRIYRSLLDNWN